MAVRLVFAKFADAARRAPGPGRTGPLTTYCFLAAGGNSETSRIDTVSSLSM